MDKSTIYGNKLFEASGLVGSPSVLVGLKETEMFFVNILPWTPIHSHQFHEAKLLEKMSDVISSNVVMSNLQKFLCSVATMVVPGGSLNSWNQ